MGVPLVRDTIYVPGSHSHVSADYVLTGFWCALCMAEKKWKICTRLQREKIALDIGNLATSGFDKMILLAKLISLV